MKRLAWLDEDTPLPPVEQALPEGLLAAGGGLSLRRLEEAYRKGVFPWFGEGDPVLWWSPDPRMVLEAGQLRVSHSLAKKLRQVAREESSADARIRLSTDLAFDRVIAACAAPRDGQPGTWISPAIQAAYRLWHRAGRVHSVETWIDGELAGGLYGVSLDGFFFGESMFTRASDASKLAVVYLMRFLARHGVRHVDCQQETRHLRSLGARPIPRREFQDLLRQGLDGAAPPWRPGQLLQDGRYR